MQVRFEAAGQRAILESQWNQRFPVIPGCSVSHVRGREYGSDIVFPGEQRSREKPAGGLETLDLLIDE